MEGKYNRRRWLWIALVLLVLYPLSFGPAAWVVHQLEPDGYGPIRDIFTTFYRPLGWVTYDTAMQGWIAEYLYWFVPEDF